MTALYQSRDMLFACIENENVRLILAHWKCCLKIIAQEGVSAGVRAAIVDRAAAAMADATSSALNAVLSWSGTLSFRACLAALTKSCGVAAGIGRTANGLAFRYFVSIQGSGVRFVG